MSGSGWRLAMITEHTPGLPVAGFLRLPQIVGDPKSGRPPLIPVSRSTWWAGVATGRFPAPVKLGPRITAWRVEDIQALIADAGREPPAEQPGRAGVAA